jgi:hypothetical protein
LSWVNRTFWPFWYASMNRSIPLIGRLVYETVDIVSDCD